MAAHGLENTWRSSAVTMYRNWLTFINARRVEPHQSERFAAARSR
jgi:homoserine trans-succinylase